VIIKADAGNGKEKGKRIYDLGRDYRAVPEILEYLAEEGLWFIVAKIEETE
jgi:hypothetical protein